MIDRPRMDRAAGLHLDMDATLPRYTRRDLELARYLRRNPTARTVVRMLTIRPGTARELADFLDEPRSTIRGHLLTLRRFGLLRPTRRPPMDP